MTPKNSVTPKTPAEAQDGAAVGCSAWLGVATIMQGLLASGHYTYNPVDLDTGDIEPGVLRWDTGAEWKDEGECRRHRAYVLDDALSLWRELQHEMRQTPNDPSSATRPARASDCNREAMAGFAAAHG